IRIDPRGDKSGFSSSQRTGRHDNVADLVGRLLKDKTYFFDALRTPRSFSRFGKNEILRPNAENLPEMLNILQGRKTDFERYVAEVNRILALVKWISVTPSLADNDSVEIHVSSVDESVNRPDLSNPLSQCGTGVGQVLAILYVVLRTTGNVIIIDEPNSFLHP